MKSKTKRNHKEENENLKKCVKSKEKVKEMIEKLNKSKNETEWKEIKWKKKIIDIGKKEMSKNWRRKI